MKTEKELMQMYRGDGQGFHVANMHRKLKEGKSDEINEDELIALRAKHNSMLSMDKFREDTKNGPF